MTTFEQVKKIIVEKLGVAEDKVTETADITNDLGADSLDTVELIMELEKEFGITIDDQQAMSLKTVKDVMAFIDAQKK